MPPKTKRARSGDGSGDDSGSEYVPSGNEVEVQEEEYVAPSSSNPNEWVNIQSSEDSEINKWAIKFANLPKDIRAQMNKLLKDDNKMMFTVSPEEDEFDGLVREYYDDDKQETKNEEAKEFFQTEFAELSTVMFKGFKVRAFIDLLCV